MITYTVWVIVERHNDKTDEYEDLDLPFAGAAEFKSQRKAEDFAASLNDLAEQMAENHKDWPHAKAKQIQCH